MPAQKSDRAASKARSRVVLASIIPVHGSAARLLLRTLTDEFAFRRISRIDVRVLPIQIKHRWQDIAASTPPLPCADYLAVTNRVGVVRGGVESAPQTIDRGLCATLLVRRVGKVVPCFRTSAPVAAWRSRATGRSEPPDGHLVAIAPARSGTVTVL